MNSLKKNKEKNRKNRRMEGTEEQMLLFVFDEVIIIFRIPTDQYSFLLKSDVRCTY